MGMQQIDLANKLYFFEHKNSAPPSDQASIRKVWYVRTACLLPWSTLHQISQCRSALTIIEFRPCSSAEIRKFFICRAACAIQKYILQIRLHHEDIRFVSRCVFAIKLNYIYLMTSHFFAVLLVAGAQCSHGLSSGGGSIPSKRDLKNAKSLSS